ncbi:MAG: hypothetical protein E6Q34_04755 [Burkholderiaceae bacterium]|nr:MAG: hypothetical protein E6Q34_04755 [Burkholderiaceae bacterium]
MLELFVAVWWKTIFRIAVIPAAFAMLLAIIPGGQFITVLVLFCLCFPASLVFGRKGFSPEFFIPDSDSGIFHVILFWALFSAIVAAIRVAYELLFPTIEE